MTGRGWPIVTLTTDFGTADHYVAAVKGALLSVTRDLHIVDVTHDVPAHDVAAGAWILRNAAPSFPPGTVHLAVVDPGVGTARRPIAVMAPGGRAIFVGPDNGLFTFVLREDPSAVVLHLTRVPAPPGGISPVFHGRDLFAPAAAMLACGDDPRTLGDPVSDPVMLPAPPELAAEAGVRLRVSHVDRFGNVVLDLSRSAAPPWLRAAAHVILSGPSGPIGRVPLVATYGEAPDGNPAMLWSSSGFLELGANRARAAEILGLRAGDVVLLEEETEEGSR